MANIKQITAGTTTYDILSVYSTTTADTSNTLYPVGVTSGATTTLKRDTSITMAGGTITATTFSGALTGNAATATAFSAAKSVALTGDVTGSASSTAGWSVATTLASSGVTAGSYGPSANASPAHGGTFSVPYVTFDAKGRATAASTKTITLPADSDTKNTAGSTDTSSKIYLVGATSQAANPQTYSDNQIYATSGQLDANKVRIAEAATIQYNSTNKCIEFVFS